MRRSENAARDGASFFLPDFSTLVLALIAAFLVFVIVSGTVWAFAKNRGAGAGESRSLFESGKPDRVPENAIFSDIGRLRAATADERTVTVVITPFLRYAQDDVPFREELVQKNRTIRAFILDWFHARTIREIGKIGEAGVKAALIEGINGLFALGKIDAIYFSEFMVIE